MKIKTTTFCLLLVAILFSCKKEDLNHNGGSTTASYIPILSKILIDNQSSNEFQYNDSNMIRQENSKLDLILHHYNAKGQLVTSEYWSNDDVLSSDASVSQTAMTQTSWVTLASGKKGGVVTYQYDNNGQLTKAISTHPSLTCTEYSLFTYDVNNRISRQSTYWEDKQTGYLDYSYDSKGNLTSKMLYSLSASGDPVPVTSTKYSFDGGPNPFKVNSRSPIPGISTNVNNITKETYTIFLPAALGSDKVTVTENVYTYNTLGYPVSKNGNITYVYE